MAIKIVIQRISVDKKTKIPIRVQFIYRTHRKTLGTVNNSYLVTTELRFPYKVHHLQYINKELLKLENSELTKQVIFLKNNVILEFYKLDR